MKNKMMSPGEINNSVYNLREIEKCLGHSIPPGYFDAGSYCDRKLTSGEAYVVAQNIREMEKARRFDHPKRPATSGSGRQISNLEAYIGLAILIIGSIVVLFTR